MSFSPFPRCSFQRKLFSKTTENLFPVFAQPDTNTRRAGRILDFVSLLHNCLEFSQPFSCLYQAMQTRKTFSIAKCYTTTQYKILVYSIKQETELSNTRILLSDGGQKKPPKKETPWGKKTAGNLGWNHGSNSKQPIQTSNAST